MKPARTLPCRAWSLMAAAITLAFGIAATYGVEVPGPDGNPGNLARLLHNPAVLQEVGLSEKQVAEARDVSKQVLEEHRQAFADSWALGNGPKRRIKVGEVFLSVTNETFAGLESILSNTQLERLKQLEMQYFGARALGRPNVIETLGLTSEQQQGFQQLASAYGEKLATAFGDQSLTLKQREQKRAELRVEVAREIRNRLTPEQRPKWDKLLGAPFQP